MQVKNYTLIEVREIPEIHATGYLYEHNKTKARVLYLHAPEDDNQVFSISFATPPENDCGIPHILEHCVLNGSDKYPVKEPFVDLLKGSLNTFLNAMTFPDKTMFPVASRNEQDFMNLMSVYLDAVFFPNLRKDPFIFRQEGWHYELEGEDAEVVYKGVVYNEMKGAYSSGDSVNEFMVNRAVYPDSIYGFESGGHPDAIPDLTYEQFKAFHEKNYHPCNSFVFFYGNGDIAKHMTYVDEEYLQKFPEPKEGQVAVIGDQPRFTESKEVKSTYAVGEEEDLGNKTFLSYNVLLDHITDPKTYFVLDVLGELVCESEASPLKRALLKAGIGQDISCRVDVSVKEPKFSVIAKNADAEQKDEFVAIVKEVLNDIAVNGFDPKLVEASLAQNLFSMREANYGSAPKGLLYGIQCMDSWLYGGNPMDFLAFEENYAKIKEDTGCFANFIRDHILNNPHTVIGVLEPEAGLNAKVDAKVKAELKAYKESLSEEEVKALVESTKAMIERQQTPDRPEDLAKLPMLKREDLEVVKPFHPAKEVMIAGRKASVYTDTTNNIIYLTFSFSMDHLPEEYIPYAALLTDVISNVDTAKRSYMDLDNEIGCHMGGMTVNTTLLQHMDDTFEPYFNMGVKFLKEETKASVDLMKEILLESDLADADRLMEIIEENMSGMEDHMSAGGNRTATARAFSYFDPYYAYNEKINGIDYYHFLKALKETIEKDPFAVITKMQETLEILIREGNLRAKMTVDPENEKEMIEVIEAFTKALPVGVSEKASDTIVRIQPEMKNEGWITPGKVQYVVKAGKTSMPFNGAMAVLQQITRLEYLWNEIRVMGGAYGCSCSIDRHGRVVMSSYRDPNLAESVKVYQNAGNFLANLEISDSEMLKYIIGTMNGLDPVMTVSMKGKLANDALETGMPCDLVTKLSQEVLEVTPEKIHEAAKALTEGMNDPYICVLGSETKIKENAELFAVTKNLF